MIFSGYYKFFKLNLDVLDAVSMRAIKLVDLFSARDIANIIFYCSKINYINHILIDAFEREIIRREKP